jgi:hypothetical protein
MKEKMSYESYEQYLIRIGKKLPIFEPTLPMPPVKPPKPETGTQSQFTPDNTKDKPNS